MPSPWYIARGKQKVGPHTYEELRRMAAAGQFLPSDMVLNEGSTQWVSAGDVPGLSFGPKKAGPTDGTGGKTDAWYFARNGQRFGPFAFEQFRQMAASGLLSRDDMVANGEAGRWISAGVVAGLFGESPGIPLAQPVGRGDAPAIPLAMPVRDGASPRIPLAMPVAHGDAAGSTPAMPAERRPPAVPRCPHCGCRLPGVPDAFCPECRRELDAGSVRIDAVAARGGASQGGEPPALARPSLWNPNAASSWSFLFTPAFGAWLHAANWRALGRPGKARMSMAWVWLTAAFLAVGLVLPFLPGLERENGWMGGVGLLLFLVWYFAQGAWHAKYVGEHYGDDYDRRGWSLPLLAGFAATAGYVAVFYALAVAAYRPEPAELAEAVKPLILREWQKVPGLRDSTIQGIVLAHEGGKKYTGFVNATIGGRAARLALEVVADRGTILWKVAPSSSAPDFGTLVEFNGGELYYTAAVTEGEARKLGAFLVEEKLFDGGRKTVQLDKSGDTYEVRLVAKRGVEQDPDFIATMKRVASEISKRVVGSAPVDVHLCDENLRTVRVVVPER